jgi:hypothetical protein
MFPRPDSDFVTLHNSERRPAAQKPHFEGPTPLDPWLDRNSRASEYDEPSNEELGIVPYRGWRLAAGWLIAFIASLGIALGVGKAMLWAFAFSAQWWAI